MSTADDAQHSLVDHCLLKDKTETALQVATVVVPAV